MEFTHCVLNIYIVSQHFVQRFKGSWNISNILAQVEIWEGSVSLNFYHALLLSPNIAYISRQYPCVFEFFVKQVSCINYRSHSALEAWLILCNFRSIIPSGICRDRTYLDLAAPKTWNENNYTSGHSRLPGSMYHWRKTLNLCTIFWMVE